MKKLTTNSNVIVEEGNQSQLHINIPEPRSDMKDVAEAIALVSKVDHSYADRMMSQAEKYTEADCYAKKNQSDSNTKITNANIKLSNINLILQWFFSFTCLIMGFTLIILSKSEDLSKVLIAIGSVSLIPIVKNFFKK